MATYRLSAKVISRSTGRSSVAAAAYRAAEKILDTRINQTFNYQSKQGVDHKEIITPDNAPEWTKDRAQLWNAVEHIEKRKDAQVAREIQLSLPKEFSQSKNIKLAQDFVKEHFVAHGMIADMALHHLNEHNPHAHILLTTRTIGPDGFGQKERSWNQKQLLQDWRKAWEVHLNAALAREGIEQTVDCRSYEDQKLNIESQHIGCAAHHMHAGGEENLSEVEKLKRIQFENGQRIIEDPNVALEALTHQRATFSKRDLARFINTRTVDSEQFDRAYTAVLAHEDLVYVGRDTQGTERYTTQAMLKLEQRLFEHTASMNNQNHAIKRDHFEQALAQRPSMTLEQKQGLAHLLDKGDIQCLVGVAGSGKSFLLDGAREAWEAAGYRVKGAALSGIVAQSLRTDASIEQSRTIASWQYQWAQGRNQLSANDVLVVDEAGLVGTRQMEALLQQARNARAKVVLVGDAQQLQAIEAGAAFRGICERVGYVELDTVRRQQHTWQREATKAFAKGNTELGLQAYQQHGCVQFEQDKSSAHHALIDAWARDREANASQVILAHTRADIATLNALAREKLIERGELEQGTSHALVNGARHLSVGDSVVFLKNDNDLNVKNGTRGIVTYDGGQGELLVQVGERSVSLNTQDYNHLDHGYALTVHKSQGLTVDRSYVYASRGFDKHLSYVSLSRHKEKTSLYADFETFKNYAQLAQHLSRTGEKDLVKDYAHNRHLDANKSSYSDFIAEVRQSYTPEPKIALEGVYARISAKLEHNHAAISSSRPESPNIDATLRADLDALETKYGHLNVGDLVGEHMPHENLRQAQVPVDAPELERGDPGTYSPDKHHHDYVRDALKEFEQDMRHADMDYYPIANNYPELFPEQVERNQLKAEQQAEQEKTKTKIRAPMREVDYEIEL